MGYMIIENQFEFQGKGLGTLVIQNILKLWRER